MGRPDLTEQRTEEILDAFERCVGRAGLAGTSLEEVAAEAGVKRSILRHYVGNRDDLIDALGARVFAKYRAHMEGTLPHCGSVAQLLDFFFPVEPVMSSKGILVVESLIAAAPDHPQIHSLTMAYLEDLVGGLAKRLRGIYPGATQRHTWDVAYGVVGICFNHESLVPLQLPARYLRGARAGARRLIETLAPDR